MAKQEIIKLSIQGGIAIILLILLLTMCGRNRNADNGYKELVAAKDTIIKKEHEKIDIYERLIEEKQKTFEALTQKDSILSHNTNTIELSIKKINDQISNIPIRIAKLGSNADSIIRAYAEFE